MTTLREQLEKSIQQALGRVADELEQERVRLTKQVESQASTIERLTAQVESLQQKVHLWVGYDARTARIEKLERVYEAATNLVRAEGWQIERDNLWDTLHDLIDAEDEAIADMEQT